MSQASGQPDLAALREEIRKAVEPSRSSRLGRCVSWMVAAVWLFGAVLAADWGWAGGAVIALVLASAAAGSILFPAEGYRLRRRDQIRRSLEDLPPHQRAEVLLPLQDEPGEVGLIARSLVRQLGAPTEVSHAARPEGRGSEPTPSD